MTTTTTEEPSTLPSETATGSSAFPLGSLTTTNSVVTTVPPATVTISNVPITASLFTPNLATTSVVTDNNVVCPDGWEKCKDGTCEPFHFLCTEHDGSPPLTTRSPQASTTMLLPGMNKTTTSLILTPAATTSSPTTELVTQPPSTTTTTSSVPLTPNNGQCPDGFVACNDGTCEPFAFNCNETGLTEVTFPTWEPVTTSTANIPGTSNVSNVSMATSGLSGTVMTSTSVMGNVTGTVPTAPVSVSLAVAATSIAPVTVGQCPDGFFTCSDGTCEPYESNCEETGLVTGTFPTKDPMQSSTAPSGTTVVTSSSNVTMATGGTMNTGATTQTDSVSTTLNIPTTTATTTLAAVTDSSGNEVCKDGWEQCQDGTCEPFHFLCLEHSSGSGVNIIG
ncbi:hypothetical protein ACF0H5_012047 [Mactra antiquata]